MHLYKNGNEKTLLVHRLVAEAFVPNVENKPHIDHINGNKLDNRAKNLRWATPRENCNNFNTLKKRCKPVIGISLKDGHVVAFSSTAEADRNGFNGRHIAECARNKTNRKTHKGYAWKYI